MNQNPQKCPTYLLFCRHVASLLTIFANLNPSFERKSNNNSFFQGTFDEIND
jgi:hypothetical protein